MLPGAGYKVDFKDHRITKAISLTSKKKLDMNEFTKIFAKLKYLEVIKHK